VLVITRRLTGALLAVNASMAWGWSPAGSKGATSWNMLSVGSYVKSQTNNLIPAHPKVPRGLPQVCTTRMFGPCGRSPLEFRGKSLAYLANIGALRFLPRYR